MVSATPFFWNRFTITLSALRKVMQPGAINTHTTIIRTITMADLINMRRIKLKPFQAKNYGTVLNSDVKKLTIIFSVEYFCGHPYPAAAVAAAVAGDYHPAAAFAAAVDLYDGAF